MGKAGEIMPLLRHSADPRLRSFIINWLSPLGADPKLIVAELDRIDPKAKPTPAPWQQLMDAVLFNPETSQRRALILALGTYGTEGLSPGEREPLINKLLDLYRNDPDSGIHGAAEWTLRQWKQQEKLKELDAELMKLKDWGERRWYVNGQGQTYAVIEGPVEFRMGSPPTDPDRNAKVKTPRRIVIPRRFAIASKEVTVEQYQRFVKTNPQFGLDPSFLARYSPDGAGPMISVTWFGAAAYCNWLSEQEGLDKCYERRPKGDIGGGMTIPADVLRSMAIPADVSRSMTIPADVLKRTGYRLPTEAEWEYACRSGTITSRYYGVSTDLLGKYAWYRANSREHAWPGGSLIPNELGLFDMLGNVVEWVQDPSERPFEQLRFIAERPINTTDDIDIHLLRLENAFLSFKPRILRGGSFNDRPAEVRSAFRGGDAPANRSDIYGFRPSRTYH